MIETEQDFDDAVRNYKEHSYKQVGNVFVYDEPIICYFEVWQVKHEGYSMLAILPEEFYDDAKIIAFSKDDKALEEYRGNNNWTLVRQGIAGDMTGVVLYDK